MRTRLSLLVCISIMLITFTGCPYESNIPLGDAKDSEIDPQLLGTWIIRNAEIKSRYDTIIFKRFNEHEYYLESHEMKNGKPFTDRGRGFIIRIDGHKILNLSSLNQPEQFFFATYQCSGDHCITRYASDHYIKTEFRTADAFREYFKIHMEKAGFFEEGDTLIRLHPINQGN